MTMKTFLVLCLTTLHLSPLWSSSGAIPLSGDSVSTPKPLTILDLPQNMLYQEVFLRLPVLELTRVRQSCKTWHELFKTKKREFWKLFIKQQFAPNGLTWPMLPATFPAIVQARFCEQLLDTLVTHTRTYCSPDLLLSASNLTEQRTLFSLKQLGELNVPWAQMLYMKNTDSRFRYFCRRVRGDYLREPWTLQAAFLEAMTYGHRKNDFFTSRREIENIQDILLNLFVQYWQISQDTNRWLLDLACIYGSNKLLTQLWHFFTPKEGVQSEHLHLHLLGWLIEIHHLPTAAFRLSKEIHLDSYHEYFHNLRNRRNLKAAHLIALMDKVRTFNLPSPIFLSHRHYTPFLRGLWESFDTTRSRTQAFWNLAAQQFVLKLIEDSLRKGTLAWYAQLLQDLKKP